MDVDPDWLTLKMYRAKKIEGETLRRVLAWLAELVKVLILEDQFAQAHQITAELEELLAEFDSDEEDEP